MPSIELKAPLDLLILKFKLLRNDNDCEFGLGKLAGGFLAMEQDSSSAILQEL